MELHAITESVEIYFVARAGVLAVTAVLLLLAGLSALYSKRADKRSRARELLVLLVGRQRPAKRRSTNSALPSE
ncbi:hypothetical protein [Actinokineospora xionganensis]|uniref:Uncharacterized protein n=1 Tax=Actinokineospora xionganensis TaxID=2684470 RepID=A0ABR7LAH4_9PSEU|nr:hypothetical protein [Actinokineospora xionganensis]MBC6449714.1 hypothetical protein [Actinokineospora xionganensis]